MGTTSLDVVFYGSINYVLLAGLQLAKYQTWFKKMVPAWMKVSMVTCKAKIDKAVELDKVHEQPIGALSSSFAMLF